MNLNTTEPHAVYDSVPNGADPSFFTEGYACCVSFFFPEKTIFLSDPINLYGFIDIEVPQLKKQGLCTAYFIFYDEFDYECYYESLYNISELIEPIGKVIFHKDFLSGTWKKRDDNKRIQMWYSTHQNMTYYEMFCLHKKYTPCFRPNKFGFCNPLLTDHIQMYCEEKCILNKRYNAHHFDRHHGFGYTKPES